MFRSKELLKHKHLEEKLSDPRAIQEYFELFYALGNDENFIDSTGIRKTKNNKLYL